MPVPKLEARDTLTISGAWGGGKGTWPPSRGPPSRHKRKASGSAEAEEHVTGTQLALWPRAQTSTPNPGGNQAWPHVQTALHPTPTIFRAQSSPSVLNSKAWILMITFQAQGFREFGSVLFWFFTLIREPAKLVLRVPFPIRFPPKKSLWGAWALTGVFRGSLSLVPGRKGGGGYLGKVEKQQGEESTATKPSATGERTGLKTQVSSELPRHSADDHGGTLKRPIGGPRGSLGKVPVPRKPQTGRRGNHA